MPTTAATILSDGDVKAIDSLVDAGLFNTRADLLRAAVRNFLWEEAPLELEHLSMIRRGCEVECNE